MKKKLLLTLLLATGTAQADESTCLSKILYSEGQGESIEGVIALGEATKSRAKRSRKSICKVAGVTRKQPPVRLEYYWVTLAKTIIADGKKPITKGADSWNTGKRTAYKGDIKRRIGKHTFYVMAGEL